MNRSLMEGRWSAPDERMSTGRLGETPTLDHETSLGRRLA
jgi:hypothetical protein